jgi:hypothetical protein
MKHLYDFTVKKSQVVDKEEIVTENGEQVKKIKQVKEEVPVKYFIKKPSRSDFDDSELFYGVELARGVKEGMLTKSMLIKRFSNDGGLLSEPQKNKYAELYLGLGTKENELQRLVLSDKKEETEEQRKALEKELLNIRTEIQEFEFAQSSIFDQTAENRARNKTIYWWFINLAHKADGDKEIPLFAGNTFQEKLKSYDTVTEQEDEHLGVVIQKFIYFVTMWYVGQASKQSDFELLEKNLESQ